MILSNYFMKGDIELMKKVYKHIVSLLILINFIGCQANKNNDVDTVQANNQIKNVEMPKYDKDELHKAANKGDIEKVKEILKTKIDVDERDSFGGTALHAAMFQDNIKIVKILIENGFDINAKGISNGYTPLHDAVWANNLEAVKVLVENGADTNIKAKDGLTPIQKAEKEGKKEIYNYLKSIGNK